MASRHGSKPSLQVTAPPIEYSAPNGRALSPPPKSPTRFTAPDSIAPTKGASWLFNTLSGRPKVTNGIEHQVGLKPPTIDEDEREAGIDASNASVLSFNSSIEVASEGGAHSQRNPRRAATDASSIVRPMSADGGPPVRTRMSVDDGYVRINKPSNASSMRKSDTMPRLRVPDSLPDRAKDPSSVPLTSLYLVSGLPKNPSTWTLADADSVVGVHHSEGAVGRWWRAEVLGSTITPGVNGGKDKKKKRSGKSGSSGAQSAESKAGLGKGDLGKMLSKSLKLSFPREVEIIASTLQPPSTIHSFTFTIPTVRELTAPSSHTQLRSSVFSNASSAMGTAADRSSAAYAAGLHHLGVPGGSHIGLNQQEFLDQVPTGAGADPMSQKKETTYHGVCLTVWSHADEERTAAIRRTLETAAYARSRTHKASMSSMATSIAPSVASTNTSIAPTPSRPRKRSVPWSGTEMDESETDTGAMTESEADFSGNVDGAGASTLFLPQNTVFWLPYALTLVSRHPIYDLMRDYLTLSWARFSKDVQSHTLQIAKILEAPSPRAGDIIRLDAGASGEHLEVVCRFPGGLDFGRGLVDVNFTMWPIFRCLNLDNILTLCEIALAPTGRVLFISRHPAMLGIAVSTLKYLVELRGWNGVAYHNVHARDAKIYLEDPGPWIIAMSTESRYCVRPSPEVCICDLDINYVNCPAPPPNAISTKQTRDKYRKMLMSAFDQYFHPDHGVPSEFKEAFPAGRFRPLCKITSKRGSSVVAESIKAPEWWHQTRVVTAFDTVLRERAKKPSLIKRITTLGIANKRPSQLSPAERMIQMSIRKRATAFVDARDDLETKIGRLSRRLNFLMTESELWRQKFVAFEGYAEKLSAEAGELRAKINKEQRESKRLSGLVSVTAHEKYMLQSKLADTEAKHKRAVFELDQMRVEMEEMEVEREKMVEEVEAQIERALASMTLSDHYESDYSQGSNLSRRSTMSNPAQRFGGSRSGGGSRPGTSSGAARPLRSFATASTLSGDPEQDETMVLQEEGAEQQQQRMGNGSSLPSRKQSIDSKRSASVSASGAAQRKRRFSNSGTDPNVDSLDAVDVGISQRIDTVAEKMLAIQQKLENAFEASRRTRSRAGTPHTEFNSGDEGPTPVASGSRPPSRNRPPPRYMRSGEGLYNRNRTQSFTSNGGEPSNIRKSPNIAAMAIPPVPPVPQSVTTMNGALAAPQPIHRIASGASLTATRPSPPEPERPRVTSTGTVNSQGSTAERQLTDDSDDSYMSAYSASPPGTEKGLHGEDEDEEFEATMRTHEINGSVASVLLQDHDITRDFGKGPSPLLMLGTGRERSMSNVSTATAREEREAAKQQVQVASAAEHAVNVAVQEIASPTVSEHSTISSNTASNGTATTRLTSVLSNEC